MKSTYLLFTLLFCISGFWSAARAAPDNSAKLKRSILLYENGEYIKAVDSLKAILPSLRGNDKGLAYKHLAFCYAMLNMESTAQRHFSRMLKSFPEITVDTVMVPPQITRVYKMALSKTGASLKKTDKPTKKARGKTRKADRKKKRVAKKPKAIRTTPSPMWWILPGIAGAGSGAFSLLMVDQAGKTEKKYYNPDLEKLPLAQRKAKFRELRTKLVKEWVFAGVGAGTSAVCLGFGLYRFSIRNTGKKRAGLEMDPSGFRITYNW